RVALLSATKSAVATWLKPRVLAATASAREVFLIMVFSNVLRVTHRPGADFGTKRLQPDESGRRTNQNTGMARARVSAARKSGRTGPRRQRHRGGGKDRGRLTHGMDLASCCSAPASGPASCNDATQ